MIFYKNIPISETLINFRENIPISKLFKTGDVATNAYGAPATDFALTNSRAHVTLYLRTTAGRKL